MPAFCTFQSGYVITDRYKILNRLSAILTATSKFCTVQWPFWNFWNIIYQWLKKVDHKLVQPRRYKRLATEKVVCQTVTTYITQFKIPKTGTKCSSRRAAGSKVTSSRRRALYQNEVDILYRSTCAVLVILNFRDTRSMTAWQSTNLSLKYKSSKYSELWYMKLYIDSILYLIWRKMFKNEWKM